MKSINSLSGGKTSSYLAVHYPADYNIFSLVRIEDKKCSPKDKQLIKMVSDKLGVNFVATAESDKTLKVMFDLEQILGKEIIWVTGKSFDEVILKKKALPNELMRFCTTEMKLKPIFDWWLKNINEKVKMGIGFRYDEKERADRFTTSFKTIVGKRKTQNKWEEIEWREGYFPLIDNKIFHYDIYKWSIKSGIDFPEDSNCVGCFHKQVQQLRKNWDDEPLKMQWFSDQEKKHTWKKEISFNQIKKVGKQLDFIYGGGSGCQAGFCTD
jgi:hypothetical protein